MKHCCTLACALALAGCAATPAAPPGTVVLEATIARVLRSGVTTKATLLAELGLTTAIRFDNGVEVWRYLTPAPGGAHATDGEYSKYSEYGEYVIVFDARGVVLTWRHARRVYHWPPQK